MTEQTTCAGRETLCALASGHTGQHVARGRCPVHAAVLPCDGDHEARRAAVIVATHATGDHSLCSTYAQCEDGAS
jgi:hypothetical protein